jgi:uncharacterized SAM-binding protein YcdF (DUF218 family)
MNPEVIETAAVLWEYHQVHHQLRPCDVMVVLCSNDLRVSDYSVELAGRGYARTVVFTGGVAHQDDLLATGWTRPEAEVFAERARERGLVAERVLLETTATHTGENFAFTERLLHAHRIDFRSALVVQKPFMERRAFATGRRCWPEVDLVVTSPPIPFLDYLRGAAQPAENIINIMVGDLQRIELYGRKGFQIPQEIPPDVWAAYHRLLALGYDRHLVRE